MVIGLTRHWIEEGSFSRAAWLFAVVGDVAYLTTIVAVSSLLLRRCLDCSCIYGRTLTQLSTHGRKVGFGPGLILRDKAGPTLFQADLVEHFAYLHGVLLPFVQVFLNDGSSEVHLEIDVILNAFLVQLKGNARFQASVDLKQIELLGVDLDREVTLLESEEFLVCLYL